MADFVQEDDPGAVGAFKTWGKISTGTQYIRNSSNTDWNIDGNINLTNKGFAVKSGYVSTGAITGETGILGLSSPNCHTSAQLCGSDLATVDYLSTMRDNVIKNTDSKIIKSISLYTNPYTENSVSNTTVVKTGILTFNSCNILSSVVTQTIPLPDGITDETKCKWIVAPVACTFIGGTLGESNFIYLNSSGTEVDPLATRTFWAGHNNPGATPFSGAHIAYMIIGVKS